MDGFKNSTKTQYTSGGSCYAKGGSVKGAAKMAKVMGEFKSGKLHSGSKHGPEVTNPKQATAIAMSEARKAGAKIPMKKGGGGSVEADDVLMSSMTKDELAQGAKGVRMARERMSKERVNVPAKKLPPKAVPVAPKRPLVEAASEYGPASSLRIPLKKGGQPVQKKSLGGVLKALSPAAALVGSGVGKDLMGSGAFGLGGMMLSQLLKKKQSGQTLTPAENQQVAQASSAPTAAKKGGMIKKGVPVAAKGPMVGLAAIPKKK